MSRLARGRLHLRQTDMHDVQTGRKPVIIRCLSFYIICTEQLDELQREKERLEDGSAYKEKDEKIAKLQREVC